MAVQELFEYVLGVLMRKIIRIEAKGQITWAVAPTANGRWLAVCKTLGLTMEGDTLDDLNANINDTVQLLLTDLFESGEFETFLKNRGWSHREMQVQEAGPLEFDVPIELLVHSGRDSARPLLQ